MSNYGTTRDDVATEYKTAEKLAEGEFRDVDGRATFPASECEKQSLGGIVPLKSLPGASLVGKEVLLTDTMGKVATAVVTEVVYVPRIRVKLTSLDPASWSSWEVGKTVHLVPSELQMVPELDKLVSQTLLWSIMDVKSYRNYRGNLDRSKTPGGRGVTSWRREHAEEDLVLRSTGIVFEKFTTDELVELQELQPGESIDWPLAKSSDEFEPLKAALGHGFEVSQGDGYATITRKRLPGKEQV